MGLHTPQSAVLAAVIFNALIIIALVPLALRGVKYRPLDAASLLRRNLLIYGIGGILAPFPGIWIIDQFAGGISSRVGAIMWQQILPGLRIKLFMTVLLGVIYPLAHDRHLAGFCFPKKANGSLKNIWRKGDRLGVDRPEL